MGMYSVFFYFLSQSIGQRNSRIAHIVIVSQEIGKFKESESTHATNKLGCITLICMYGRLFPVHSF